MTAIAHTHDAHQSVKQSLVNSTVSASNASSGPSTFHSILSALGLGSDAESSPAIPASTARTTANAGAPKPSGQSILTAKARKTLGHKGLKSLKVLTPDQAAQLAVQSQTAQAETAQSALASSLASTPAPSSSGWSVNSTISSVESAIKGGISDVIDALGGRSSNSSTPVAPPLAAPIVAAGGNVAQSKAQAQAAANTATSANSEALDVTLAQAMSLNSAQDPDAADSAMDASALQGARITAAKNPSSDQMAASKQQAFADLKPAADVKATDAQVLSPDAGLSKADSKDAKGGDSGNANDKPQDNAQSSSSTTPGSQPSDPQQIVQPASQDASFATQVANNAAANSAAAAAAGTPNHSAIAAPANNVAVAPAADQSPAMKLDTGSLAVTIAAKSIEGAKQFDIRLDPPELGRVDVKLSMDSTGKAQAHLSVEKPATLDMLQKDSGTLQRSLKESGLNLSNNGLQFSLKNQQQSSATLQQSPRGRSLNINVVPVTAPVSTHGYAHGHARLDIRV